MPQVPVPMTNSPTMKNTKWHAWHAARVARQIKKKSPA